MVDVKAALIRAKEVIETNGWRQGGYGTVCTPVCLVGAIRIAVTGTTAPAPQPKHAGHVSGGNRKGISAMRIEDFPIKGSPILNAIIHVLIVAVIGVMIGGITP